ncbi:isocitrate dehydrogenase [Aureococcus anophagefferens]|nr:isocitrate dehydrogenase [Aureococcus anophagefferens]
MLSTMRAARATARSFSTASAKIGPLPLVYIKGEEMTRYASQLMMDQWIEPFIDTSKWETFDLSCAARDASDDQELRDAVEAGKRLGAIFKEPTVTPSAEQVASMGLSKALPSPNGAMRRGWDGVTISRDTIHIEGVELGFKSPVLFERHAVGGEYGAGWKEVGKGRLITTFFPEDDDVEPFIVDARKLENDRNVAVVYHNPLDNVAALADHFFSRTLKAGVTPYVVTKKTVFKWQEPFWQIHKELFDAKYADAFREARGSTRERNSQLQRLRSRPFSTREAGLLDATGGELQHLISDAATMQIIRWTRGGFGMSAHNYDGDMLTDEVAQVHRSPGFITSNLVGRNDDGTLIKEFEASHGTVSDLWHAHLRGEATSFNPLGMAEAIMGALAHAADLDGDTETARRTHHFVATLRRAMHNTFVYGQGTWDMAGPDGLTTEEFVAKVDVDKVSAMFAEFDVDGSGSISLEEFSEMMIKLGLAPMKEPEKTSASRAKIDEAA